MIFSFSDHVALLDQFLSHRAGIVERIEESLLNVREKDTARRRDRSYFDRTLNDCFFAAPGLDRDLSRLKGQLAAAHLADGFEPLQLRRIFKRVRSSRSDHSRVRILGRSSMAGKKRPARVCPEHLFRVHAAAARGP